MFPRRMRIPAAELKNLKARTRGSSRQFLLKTAPNSLGHTRFAVVVGSNVDRKSVRRHTLKRRAAAVLERKDLGSTDAVLIVLKEANNLSAPDFRLGLERVL